MKALHLWPPKWEATSLCGRVTAGSNHRNYDPDKTTCRACRRTRAFQVMIDEAVSAGQGGGPQQKDRP